MKRRTKHGGVAVLGFPMALALLLATCAISPAVVAETVVVDTFVGDIGEATLAFNVSAENTSLYIELPRGSTITDASMDLEGLEGKERMYEVLDFATGTVGNGLWAKFNHTFLNYPPAFDPDKVVWKGATKSDYGALAKSDDSWWDHHTPNVTVMPPPDYYPLQLYHFQPDEMAEEYRVSWEGFSTCKANKTKTSHGEVWLYNNTDSSWDLVAKYSSNAAADVLLQYTFRDSSGYVNADGGVMVAVFSLHAEYHMGRPPLFDTGNLWTDYVALEYCKEIVRLAKGADMLAIESAHPEGDPREGHLTPSQAARIAAEAGVKKLALTHFYPDCKGRDMAGPAKRVFKGKLVLARDERIVFIGAPHSHFGAHVADQVGQAEVNIVARAAHLQIAGLLGFNLSIDPLSTAVCRYLVEVLVV